jgi:hypothetical protein
MQPLPLVLSELLDNAKKVWSEPVPSWEPCDPEPGDLERAEREAKSAPEFDRLGLKIGVWNAYKAGHAKLVCRRLGGLARVIAFVPAGVKPAWEFWGRVFQWFGAAPDGRPWRVFWFAALTERNFPAVGQDLGPEHVNGGYTHVCSTDGICIYRAEEASRVLIHEMLHAACLDEKDWSIPMREAMIETWAELILVALVAKGKVPAAKRLWSKQSHWIVDTNAKAEKAHNMHDISDYAWRYLTGREQMYARLGVALPAPRITAGQRSVRFTHPALEV